MKDKSLLLVDDKPERLKELSGIIRNLGFSEFIEAESAEKAWFLMRSTKVDCVVCAYEMREMSGLSLLKIVRGEERFADIPFFLTDPGFTKLKVLKAGQTGVTGLFVVPYDTFKIEKRIMSSLRKKKEPVVEKAVKSYEMGKRLMDQGRYNEALEVFYDLVSRKENPEYYYNIGYIKTAQGKHSEAIEAFSKATELDRLFARAYEQMGRAFRALGKPEEAEKYMELAAEIYIDRDRIGAAEDILNEILEYGSESLNVFNTLGVIYRKKGEPETAMKYYKKALKIHDTEPYIYYNIGRLYLDMKDTFNAKSSFQRALELDPDFDHASQVIKAIDLGIV